MKKPLKRGEKTNTKKRVEPGATFEGREPQDRLVSMPTVQKHQWMNTMKKYQETGR